MNPTSWALIAIFWLDASILWLMLKTDFRLRDIERRLGELKP